MGASAVADGPTDPCRRAPARARPRRGGAGERNRQQDAILSREAAGLDKSASCWRFGWTKTRLVGGPGNPRAVYQRFLGRAESANRQQDAVLSKARARLDKNATCWRFRGRGAAGAGAGGARARPLRGVADGMTHNGRGRGRRREQCKGVGHPIEDAGVIGRDERLSGPIARNARSRQRSGGPSQMSLGQAPENEAWAPTRLPRHAAQIGPVCTLTVPKAGNCLHRSCAQRHEALPLTAAPARAGRARAGGRRRAAGQARPRP